MHNITSVTDSPNTGLESASRHNKSTTELKSLPYPSCLQYLVGAQPGDFSGCLNADRGGGSPGAEIKLRI